LSTPLQGKDDEIKESLIAIEVFGRTADYDPKQSSIVRTEAAGCGHARGVLRRGGAAIPDYRTAEGRNTPVFREIELTPTGFVPGPTLPRRRPDPGSG